MNIFMVAQNQGMHVSGRLVRVLMEASLRPPRDGNR